MRRIFFGAAAVWGFLTGTGAVIIGLAAAGQVPLVGPGLLAAIAVALVVAVLGGLLVARAYRDAASR